MGDPDSEGRAAADRMLSPDAACDVAEATLSLNR